MLIDKHAYGVRIPFTNKRVIAVGEPQRGDVVILDAPDENLTLFKRVIAVPGDVVEMRDERLIINGVAASYAPLTEKAADNLGAQLVSTTRAMQPVFFREQLLGQTRTIMVLPQIAARRNFNAMTIPAGRYLMMGDNRDNSKDSRYFGLVERDAIFGKALRVIVSFDPEHYYLPRSGRVLFPQL